MPDGDDGDDDAGAWKDDCLRHRVGKFATLALIIYYLQLITQTNKYEYKKKQTITKIILYT